MIAVLASTAVVQSTATPVPVHWYLIVSIVLFLIGITVVLTRRNLIYVLMGVELILNAAALNFIAFGSYRGAHGLVDGTVMATLIIVMAATEATIALAIVLNVFGLFQSVRPQDPNLLRE